MSPGPAPPVTVAVVTAQTRDPLRRCLDSLAPDAGSGLAAVHVVDNASTDGTAEMVAEAYPWVTLHRLEANIGYGAAVNLVAAGTDSRWLVAANSDVAVTAGALERLVATGEAHPRAGAVAPRLVGPGGADQHSAYPFPTLRFTLAFNSGIPQRSARLSDRLCLEGRWDPARRRTVPWAIAAFLLIRRDAFAEVGGFDERQWMYAEDLDLGWRLAREGWRTWHEPAAAVDHEGSVATTQAFGDARVQRWQEATYVAIGRRRGWVRAVAIGTVNVTGAALRALLLNGDARSANRGWVGVHTRALAAALRRGLERRDDRRRS